jgi:transitional endoplasmic reticulum ATPase
MGKNLEELGPKTHVAEIVHHGEKLVVPEGMDIDRAIEMLYRRKKYLETTVDINEKFDVSPFDGAYGLSQVIIEKFGWAQGKPIKTMFGEQKPQIFKIPISVHEKADVPWGHFELPNISGTLATSVEYQGDRAVFALSASVLRKDENTIKSLFDELREYLKTHSLYRGKAIRVRFRDDDGEALAMPEPTFIDVEGLHVDNLILSKELEASVRANLFTPIERVDDCILNNIKVKRGVLLGGPFGTGKTLAASLAARIAQDNGITYVYSPRASELSDAIAFAKQYQSPACVVFCEDIDREVGGQRSVAMDDILNILDGIDTKTENIITVLTTNNLEGINQAMLRPGRLDAILNISPPDAEAAERLIRYYGADAISEDEDLTEVGQSLNGQIPAVIEEAVKRAKLYQISLNDRGAAVTNVTAEALHLSAQTMTTQIELLKEKPDYEEPQIDGALRGLMAEVALENKDELVKLVKKRTAVLNR